MTTTVIVKTHDWPVAVKGIIKKADGELESEPQVIQPHSEYTFHVHDARALRIDELPKPQEQVA